MRLIGKPFKPHVSAEYISTNLRIHVDTDSLGLNDGDICPQLTNLVSGQNHGEEATNQGVAVANQTPSNKTAILLDGVNDQYSFGNVYSGMTEGTLYLLLQTIGSNGSFGGIVSNNSGSDNHYPHPGFGNVYEGWGSNSRRSYTVPGNLNSWHLLTIVSIPGEYSIYNNGSLVFNSATNTPSFESNHLFGRNQGGNFLNCKFLKYLVYTIGHNSGQVAQNKAAFASEYGLTL